MNQHSFDVKVYYFDTDSYGIVWHGTYVKWFEMGRIDYFTLLNEDLNSLKEQGVQFPVVNLDVRYKASARFGDVLTVNTVIEKATSYSIKFKHDIINKENSKLLVTGHSEVVSTNLEGKLMRKMPQCLIDKFATCL